MPNTWIKALQKYNEKHKKDKASSNSFSIPAKNTKAYNEIKKIQNKMK